MIPKEIKRFILGMRWTRGAYLFLRGRYLYMLGRPYRIRLRKYGVEIFNRIHEIMSAHGYPYFANYGTLLGVVREGGFIKYDGDVDFSIPAGTVSPSELMDAITEASGFSFKLAYEWRGRITEITFVYKGVEIDFFFQYQEGGVNYSHWYEPVDCSSDCEGGAYAFRRPIPVARNIKDVSVRGGVVPIPENADEILTSAYGDWRVPRDAATCMNYEDVRPPKTRLPEHSVRATVARVHELSVEGRT